MQLADLHKSTGFLRACAIKKTTGKSSHYFLVFTVTNDPKNFIISADDSNEPVSVLREYLLVGENITVFYDKPFASDTSTANCQVYQVETAAKIIYSVDEIHSKAQEQGVLVLILFFVIFTISLGEYLKSRASSTVE